MKVRDLIKYLQTQDEELSVGFLDHFGEFHPLTDYRIGPRMILVKRKQVEVIVIEPPDFGPEPDWLPNN